MLALIWIPGIVGLTAEKNARVSSSGHTNLALLVDFNRIRFGTSNSSGGLYGFRSSGEVSAYVVHDRCS